MPEIHLGGRLKTLIGPIRYVNEMKVSLFLSSNLCFVLTTKRNEQVIEGMGPLFPTFCGLLVNMQLENFRLRLPNFVLIKN